MARKAYSSDLTNEQWELLAPLIPGERHRGRRRTTDMREVVNGIFYRLKNGCTWENLPHDFPPGKTVYHYFRAWTLDGTIERIHDHLRREVRTEAGKEEEPTAGIIDSQSVKTTEKGGLVAMMQERRSKAVSVISSWIRWASSGA